MEDIKALNDSVGQAIPAVILPTFKILVPFLLQNKAKIQSVTPKTQAYGPHPRQELDIYLSPDETKDSPILVFLYGGGLVRGDKIHPQVPDGLVFNNLGTFFALRGITTIVPNYRRVNSEIGGEDAVYPSGGEDVSLVMKWIEGFVKAGGKRDVYLLGNSAGGLHASTFLLEPRFLEQRLTYASANSAVQLKGVINLGAPTHFDAADPSRSEVLTLYYGDEKNIKDHSPYGLLETIAKSGKSRKDIGVPKVLGILGEFDPVDEIGQPTKDFEKLWKKTWGEGYELVIIEGHNHISPPVALMTGVGEKWGEDVVKWIQEP